MNSNTERKTKLKRAVAMGIGMGISTAIYEFARASAREPDFVKAIFMGIFIFIIYLIFPAKSKNEEEDGVG